MWTANRAPSRPQRNTSIHSIASMHSVSSMTSPQPQHLRSAEYDSDVSSDTANEEELLPSVTYPMVASNNVPAMWQPTRQESGSAVSRLSQKFLANASVAEITPPAPLRSQIRHHQEPVENSPDDDAHSRSSTLGGEEQDFEFPEKMPTSLPKKNDTSQSEARTDIETAEPEPPRIPGPLESQLALLMSKIIHIERANPIISITQDDFASMQAELAALREEKKTWQKRHEALFALRDEDVENNIKIRGMLAKARRDFEAMTKLRDDDLKNLHAVRAKLAEATRKMDRMEASQQSQQSTHGRASPSRSGHGGRPGSMIMERRGTMDLFAAAKAAALEQRALELEKRNSDLVEQIEALKGVQGQGQTAGPQGVGIDELNKMVAHKAWRGTVEDLERKVKAQDAEISQLKAGSGASTGHARMGSGNGIGVGGGVDWQRVEALHEEHARYREMVGGKMQALRSEKEALQRELHRREDESHALEVKILSLERRIRVL